MKNQQGFDDLIFTGRNREYGAYMLRKRYNTSVVISLLIAIVIVSAVVVIPYLRVLGRMHHAIEGAGLRYVSVQMDKLDPPDQEELIIPPAPPPPASVQPAIRYVAPVVVDSVLPTEKPIPTVADIQATPESANRDDLQVSTSAGDNELVGERDGEGDDEPFILVEVKPTFRGGDLEEFRKWVQKRVAYPQEAQDNNIQGRVYLTFVVERDGSVSNVNIVRGVDKLLDNAAKEAIMASPKWSPGLQRGLPVRVRFSIFLNFTL